MRHLRHRKSIRPYVIESKMDDGQQTVQKKHPSQTIPRQEVHQQSKTNDEQHQERAEK